MYWINTHLTYKYILVTALASKATDESINPLCLQVKSELPGAYDARSICHGVIVRFDMEVLAKALGDSNEPFLNKPARFSELSTTNAVRMLIFDREAEHKTYKDSTPAIPYSMNIARQAASVSGQDERSRAIDRRRLFCFAKNKESKP